jgi:hypothetical protein
MSSKTKACQIWNVENFLRCPALSYTETADSVASY